MRTSTRSRGHASARNLVAAAIAVTVLGAGALVAPWSAASAAAAPAAPPAAPPAGLKSAVLPPGFADLVSAVRPAVVNVSVEQVLAAGPSAAAPGLALPPGMRIPEALRRQFENLLPPGAAGPHAAPRPHVRGAGSGFIVDPAGLVVTNEHVVRGAERVTVTLQDGRRLEARIRGTDPKTDLALLEVEAPAPLPYVAFGDSDRVRVGDWVIAVGNPFGLGGTVTAGIVSARGRDIGSGPYDDYLQVDAPINRGNSGGPLFDERGRVVGINTAIFSPTGGSVGIGFAIPANLARGVVEDLRATGRVDRGWLGVSIQAVDRDLARAMRLDGEPRGALVAEVVPDSPAAAAGLRPGDIVLELDGEPVASPKALSRLVADAGGGGRTTLRVWRDGEALDLEVSLARAPAEIVAAAGPGASAVPGGPRLGVTLAPAQGPAPGVVVAGVAPESPAARADIRPGDVIVRAGDRPVGRPAEVAEAVRDAAADDRPLVLLIDRSGARRFVAVDLAKGATG